MCNLLTWAGQLLFARLVGEHRSTATFCPALYRAGRATDPDAFDAIAASRALGDPEVLREADGVGPALERYVVSTR
jgi:hypothetical protein